MAKKKSKAKTRSKATRSGGGSTGGGRRRSSAAAAAGAAPAAGADDPIPVGKPCYPAVQDVLDDILLRKSQGWEFIRYQFGPEANMVHLYFQ